jgi:hypothetical protein
MSLLLPPIISKRRKPLQVRTSPARVLVDLNCSFPGIDHLDIVVCTRNIRQKLQRSFCRNCADGMTPERVAPAWHGPTLHGEPGSTGNAEGISPVAEISQMRSSVPRAWASSGLTCRSSLAMRGFSGRLVLNWPSLMQLGRERKGAQGDRTSSR